MPLNDKALRAKYVYLTVAGALATLRGRPNRSELEEEIQAIEELHAGQLRIPEDEHFIRSGNVIGHVATLAHNCIYNFELGDYRERKAQSAEEATGRSDGR